MGSATVAAGDSNHGVLPSHALWDALLRLPARMLYRLIHSVCRSWSPRHRHAMESPNPRDTIDANDGVLPSDVLREVLLRVPARTLYRLRAVCRSWRSLTSDPLFIKAHARRHRDFHVLVAAGAGGGRDVIDVVDHMGGVVGRIHGKQEASKGRLCASDGTVCLVWMEDAVPRVLDLTGALYHALPDVPEPDKCIPASYTLGTAASTGEHKVLRIVCPDSDIHDLQTCQVFTVGDRLQWRHKGRPLFHINGLEGTNDAVVGGAAYFFSHTPLEGGGGGGGVHKLVPYSIASFDLETEEWRPALIQGPESSDILLDGVDYARAPRWDCLHLIEANGFLATVHVTVATVDLWLLMDMEKAAWVRRYRIRPDLHGYDISGIMPATTGLVSVLQDGRVAILVLSPEQTNLFIMRTYDPRGDTCQDTATFTYSTVVWTCKGSFLC